MPHFTARALAVPASVFVVLVGMGGCQDPMAKYQSGGAVAVAPMVPAGTFMTTRPASSPAASSGDSMVVLEKSDPDFQWFTEHYRRQVKQQLPSPLSAEFDRPSVIREVHHGAASMQGLASGTFLDNLGEPVKFRFLVTYDQISGQWQFRGMRQLGADE